VVIAATAVVAAVMTVVVVVVMIAATVVAVTVPRALSKTRASKVLRLLKARLNNSNNSERHEEAGCW
jgi:uncharacterized membrane protein